MLFQCFFGFYFIYILFSLWCFTNTMLLSLDSFPHSPILLPLSLIFCSCFLFKIHCQLYFHSRQHNWFCPLVWSLRLYFTKGFWFYLFRFSLFLSCQFVLGWISNHIIDPKWPKNSICNIQNRYSYWWDAWENSFYWKDRFIFCLCTCLTYNNANLLFGNAELYQCKKRKKIVSSVN